MRAGQRRYSRPSYFSTLTMMSAFPIRLLPPTLCPVCQKLRLSFVSQRMIEKLIDYLERHRRDVCAHARSFDHVNRMAQTRSKHLRLPTIVLIDLDDVLQQDETVLTDIVQPAEKRADERGS